jgi:hypothetical protein
MTKEARMTNVGLVIPALSFVKCEREQNCPTFIRRQSLVEVSVRYKGISFVAGAVVLAAIAFFVLNHGSGPSRKNLPWHLAQLRGASLVYSQKHSGKMPPNIQVLGEQGFLHADVARLLSKEALYFAADQDEKSLAPNVVVAISRTSDDANYRSVLLGDGSVVGIEETIAGQTAWTRGGLFYVDWNEAGKATIKPATRSSQAR